MKSLRRMTVGKIALGLSLTLAVGLLLFDFLPDLGGVKDGRRQLRRLQSEIQGLLVYMNPDASGITPGEQVEIPELPEIATFITSVRNAQRETGVRSLAFDATRTETQDLIEVGDDTGESREYIVSDINVSFLGHLTEAGDFLDAISDATPVETFQYLRLSGRSSSSEGIDVSMAIHLYGIPR